LNYTKGVLTITPEGFSGSGQHMPTKEMEREILSELKKMDETAGTQP
jgi:hypothetical protein